MFTALIMASTHSEAQTEIGGMPLSIVEHTLAQLLLTYLHMIKIIKTVFVFHVMESRNLE